VPDHTVAKPGPFRAPLHTADILVLRRAPLDARMVRRVRSLPGVTQVEQFSWAQVSVQDHAINVAAVDPATYRNFNPDAVAQFQPEWNRIADGEMALRSGFRRQVTTSGFVKLGAGADAPRIHVGVYSPQIPQVDAVVNDSWIPTLGMRQDNALLISTGSSTPVGVRGPCSGSWAVAPRCSGSTSRPGSASTRRRCRTRCWSGARATRSGPTATPSSAAGGSPRSRPG
jgi:hypothetical protein